MSGEKIYIYHTNDIHSNLTYWPRLSQELREKRAMREENGDFVLAFDIGDATDRVHPLTEATDGQAITSLLNEGQYDGVTIGNNEGITNSKEQLNNLYNDANFPVILTNLYDLKTGKRPSWAKPYELFETNKGKRIGVFGLTTPLEGTYEKLGWRVTNPVKEIQQFYRVHWSKADFWILLSHLGIDDDRYLSKLFPIPLILGAHTHHVLQEGEFQAGTMLTGAGQYGRWLGEVVINCDHNRLRVESAHLLNSETAIQPALNETEKVQYYREYGHELLKAKKIAKIPENFEYSWSQQSRLADITLDALANFTGADIAVINAGLLVNDLKKGVITADDFHKTYPHPIRAMHVKISGANLQKFALEIKEIDRKMAQQPVKGFGFRGHVFGKICYKGLHIDGDNVNLLGEPVVLDKEYDVATIDYFSFLSFLDTFNENSEQTVLFPDFIRTVVANYFTKIYPYKDE